MNSLDDIIRRFKSEDNDFEIGRNSISVLSPPPPPGDGVAANDLAQEMAPFKDQTGWTPPCEAEKCFHARGGWCLYLEWSGRGARLRLEDARERCPMIYSDRPPVPANAGPSKGPAGTNPTCQACGGADFWLSIHGKQLCRRCHPPVSQSLIEQPGNQNNQKGDLS